MSHEPTEEEYVAAFAAINGYGKKLREGIAAANAIRDKRIRAEALEEAAALFDGHEDHTASAWIARAIRALKDKTDE